MVRLQELKTWARHIKRDVVALWIAARDSRTPVGAKVMAAAVAAYALSPIDLIPDFIPVLGYVDDLLIVPLGIVMTVKLIPPALLTEFRDQAARLAARPVSRAGFAAIVLGWLIAALVLLWTAYDVLFR